MLNLIAKAFSVRAARRRSAEFRPCEGPTAGTTFVEILVASAVFVAGAVSIMGSVMTLNTHRHVADTRATAASFASSTFESIRGLGIDGILAYDLPVDNAEANTVDLPGTGPVTVSLFALLTPAGDLNPTYFELGVDDASGLDTSTLPNPIEIRAVMSPYHEAGYGYTEMEFSAATMIDY